MIVVRQPDDLPRPGQRRTVLTIGTFDGLHHGHQVILGRVTERARALDADAALVTFHPHPLRVLAPDRAPRLLLTVEQKLALLEQAGLDLVAVLPFDRALATMPAEVFARETLARRLRAVEVYVGPDFRFGRGRAGNLDLLRRLGPGLGFTADAPGLVLDRGARISASRIRGELSQGNVAEATRLLGRAYRLVGTIVHGEGRGRNVLVPTANLAAENEFLPARGVYVTRTLRPAGQAVDGVTNIGTRPTFGESRITVETFLPGFTGDLYGERVELEFHVRLRDEKMFETPADLMAQIRRDLEEFERWRGGGGAGG
ncbi:MAG: riboflavin biosynthesis protein RibF [Acidobacteria bacterium]|nr:riboflavin biosynthesis protein RibF [Acidobacteriota bacterium]